MSGRVTLSVRNALSAAEGGTKVDVHPHNDKDVPPQRNLDEDVPALWLFPLLLFFLGKCQSNP